ncbi:MULTISPECIES: FAD-dependent monooxygenase [Dermacoccus]|uniref:FAD-binding domain-containing protein n=1 Tax=Dermacoccus profundi TaxID=322602 RepID=A0ABN2CIL5_9MICO|nr:FAD-dependent monooxygenase [Dermacoccus abyssi]
MNGTVTDRDSKQAEKVTARILLAADGVHSSVRQQLHPDTSFHWEGTRMFRGTAVREPFLDGATMTLIYGEEEKRFLVYPISRDVENEGEELINWVAMVPEADSRTISVDDTKNEPTDPKDVVPTFRGWGFDLARHRRSLRRVDRRVALPDDGS